MCVYLQEFDDIAGAKDTVSSGELEGIMRWEIRGENAFFDAAAAQNLAGGAGAEHHR